MLRVDARGHGASSADLDSRAYRWSELAADLLALADALGHPRLVAGGASMGAAVALHAAAAAPERVEALVLMIPPTAWTTRPAQAARYRDDADLAQQGGLQALAAAEATRPPIPIFEGLFDPAELARARFAAQDPAVLPAILRGAAASDLPEPGSGGAAPPADAPPRVGGRRRPPSQQRGAPRRAACRTRRSPSRGSSRTSAPGPASSPTSAPSWAGEQLDTPASGSENDVRQGNA